MANVYYYYDKEEHYYIEKESDDIIELTEKEKIYYQQEKPGVSGAHRYIRHSKYKGKLSYVMQDRPGISNEIQNTILTHKLLIKLAKEYREKVFDSESCIIYERGNTSEKLKFAILIGFSKNKYNFWGQLISSIGGKTGQTDHLKPEQVDH